MDKTPKNAQILEMAVTELSLATAQLVRRLRSVAGANDLGWTQLAIVSRLDKEGPATTAELARAESMTPQSMGATLAAMEKEDLVERRPHATDGRQMLYDLTAEGREARRKRSVEKREWLLAAMARLTAEEQRTLIQASALIRRLGES
ncbi:MAG TPA: MarR family transcriptional regulator [Opitutaceae bacterium]|nr:MarR family transcriptional regulator [Opitutaceae bacterium]